MCVIQKRRWSELLAENSKLRQMVEQLEREQAKTYAAHTSDLQRAEMDLRSARIELSALASGRLGDPRRQAAELLVAQLHAADRAVAQASQKQRNAERAAARLELQLASLREAEGLSTWGDGLAAQREHMAALRDELMDLRTMLGSGSGGASQSNTHVSVQQLKQLCEQCVAEF